MVNPVNPPSRPKIMGLFQGYSEPPHCNASQETDIGGNEKHWADVIELTEPLFYGFVCRQMRRILQNNDYSGYRDRHRGGD